MTEIRPIERGSVLLRFPESSDRREFIQNTLESKGLHQDVVHPPKDDEEFEEFLKKNSNESELSFLVIEKSTDRIAGAVNVSQIFLKGFCSAYLGYYLFSGFEGRGLMTDAIHAVVGYAFEFAGLHRLEANIQPENIRSIDLVKRCGFQKEGFSRKYLKIGGEWRDHERWAIIKEDWNYNAINDK